MFFKVPEVSKRAEEKVEVAVLKKKVPPPAKGTEVIYAYFSNYLSLSSLFFDVHFPLNFMCVHSCHI